MLNKKCRGMYRAFLIMHYLQRFFSSFCMSKTDREIYNLQLSIEIQNHTKQKMRFYINWYAQYEKRDFIPICRH